MPNLMSVAYPAVNGQDVTCLFTYADGSTHQTTLGQLAIIAQTGVQTIQTMGPDGQPSVYPDGNSVYQVIPRYGSVVVNVIDNILAWEQAAWNYGEQWYTDTQLISQQQAAGQAAAQALVGTSRTAPPSSSQTVTDSTSSADTSSNA